MDYVLYFDAARGNLPGWISPLISLILTLVFARNYFRPKSSDAPAGSIRRWLEMRFPFWLFAASLLLTATFIVSTVMTSHRMAHASRSAKCTIVEGTVTDFEPMPFGGHKSERFTVNGVPFAFSDFVDTGGFNQTRSHGGPIQPGSQLRICYLPKGRDNNLIIRLEIASSPQTN